MTCKTYDLTSNIDCDGSDIAPCLGIGCPVLNIKKNDNKPDLKIKVEDCNGYPIDLKNQIVEASMWFDSRLLKSVTKDQNFIILASIKAFNQLLVGDIIQISTGRNFERMTVTGFEEVRRLVYVDRGTNSTLPSAWPKATPVKCFRFLNAPAIGEMIYSDTLLEVSGEPGMVAYDLGRNSMENRTPVYGLPTPVGPYLVGSYLVYEWKFRDTCLAGCYFLEFKVLTPTTTTTTKPPDYGAGYYCIWDGAAGGYTCMYCPGVDYIKANGWSYIQGPAKSCIDLNLCRQYPNPHVLEWTIDIDPNSIPFIGASKLAYDPFVAGIPTGDAAFAPEGEWVFSDSLLVPGAPTASNIVAEQCGAPYGIADVKKYPLCGAFIIQICDSPTSESVLVST
jgi:hypothetical protein